MKFDAVILGAGAAGLMCALEAGKRGKRVAVLEHNQEPGRKILISGGGRCNFTNLHCGPENFLSRNPHFAKSALARYRPADFVEFIRSHKIAYHEKKLGQLFCDGSARQVVDALCADCRAYGVRLVMGCRVQEVSGGGPFSIASSAGQFEADSLVVATGGLSISKIGASPLGHNIASQYGLKIIERRPVLVPLVLNAEDKSRYCDLSGLAAEVVAASKRKHYREKMLVTHRGLSGPAILQISLTWQQGEEIVLDLLPEEDPPEDGYKEFLQTRIPNRLLNRLLELQGHTKTSLTHRRARGQVVENLHRWTLTPAGTEGFEKAEATAGGVDTAQVSSQTMQSKRVPGLFFAGEVIDVTGELGGFNFQWAWASGFAAGNSLG